MSEDVFAHAGLADTHADLMRNIVSLRVSQDLFDDLSDRPADWDGLRDRALMVRARLERRGIDPAAAFGQVESGQPDGEASALLGTLDDLPRLS